MDAEVGRLRRLRASALKVRAIARALSRTKAASHDPILHRGRCAAWRVARTATGHLRGHPYRRYQRDAGVGTILMNSLIATGVAFRAVNRPAMLAAFEVHLKALSRELDDARALTWAADLSDTFGRSQTEIREVLAAMKRPQAIDRLRAIDRLPAGDADWPYLAF